MIIIALLLMQLPAALPSYEIAVDPDQLEQLYTFPDSGMEIPATFTFNGVSGECTVGLRGASSESSTKKSWDINILDSGLFPGGDRILLNAHCNDPSLMRNTLGLLITRRLGFPAPLTEFCSLRINGRYSGVYERIERIDRLFYQRNGVSFGLLYKNVDATGRFALHFSDLPGLTGFEPRVDTSPYSNQLLQLIENSFREDFNTLEVSEVLAAFVVNAAIGDNSGVIRNFYVHQSDGIWHYYPWDRDASFGNSGSGEYDSLWTVLPNLMDIGYFGAARGILANPLYRSEFNDILSQTETLFRNDLLVVVDSLRLLLRSDLASDPYYIYSTAEFDSVCMVLQEDVLNRADYFQVMQLEDAVPEVQNLSISSCMEMGSSLEIKLTLSGGDPLNVPCVISVDREDEEWFYMTPTGTGEEWTLDFDVPYDAYCVYVSFCPYSANDLLPIYYPPWGMENFDKRPVAVPGARVSLAGINPEMLEPGEPVWCGDNLWTLPVTNTSLETQDLSLCRFSLGEPSGNIFLAESVLVFPGETFLLSNSAENSAYLNSMNTAVYGDAGTPYPAGTTLTLMDPSWNQLHQWAISAGDSVPDAQEQIVPCEISAGAGDDWIELYNNSDSSIDLSGWYFRDSSGNISLLPEDASIDPHRLLLIADNTSLYSHCGCEVLPLEFGLSSSQDSISLISISGNKEFSMGWNRTWPLEETGVMYLISPGSCYKYPLNWRASSSSEGTPGEYNTGWSVIPGYALLSPVYGNPNDGSFSFDYETSSLPAEAELFDLAGRRIAGVALPSGNSGRVFADFGGILPNGIYILYLKTPEASASVRFTVLK